MITFRTGAFTAAAVGVVVRTEEVPPDVGRLPVDRRRGTFTADMVAELERREVVLADFVAIFLGDAAFVADFVGEASEAEARFPVDLRSGVVAVFAVGAEPDRREDVVAANPATPAEPDRFAPNGTLAGAFLMTRVVPMPPGALLNIVPVFVVGDAADAFRKASRGVPPLISELLLDPKRFIPLGEELRKKNDGKEKMYFMQVN